MSPIAAVPHALSSLTSLSSPEVMMPSEVTSPSTLANVQPAGDSFASMLGQIVSEVNTQQVSAGQQVAALQGGQNVPLHQAVVSMEEANVSFQLMVEVRNRLMDAYQEIMRMQV